MSEIQDALLEGLSKLSALSPALNTEAHHIQEIISSPPRIVIVGRLKAGKSTLTNALLGAPVAETAALEATNVVTVYQQGAPDRAVAELRDGQQIPIITRRNQTTKLPASSTEINHIDRWMPTASLSEYSIIDTPGLATLTTANEETTRRAFIDGFEQTRDASVRADAAIFLFDSVPRKDEIDFIKKLGFTPLNTLGVLSRADGFAQGALGARDPLDYAREYSKLLAHQLKDYLLTVLPVAGLLAETSHTGVLTEGTARSIADLRYWSELDLLTELNTPDGDDVGVPLKRIVSQIGEYGLFRGRDAAAQGAAALNAWLTEKSGIPQLRKILAESLGRYARLHRAARTISAIEQLAYKYSEQRSEIRNIVFSLTTDTRLLTVRLLMDLKALLESDSSSELIPEVIQLISGTTPGEKLGIDPYANHMAIIDIIREKQNWLQNYSFGMLTPAEDAAALNIRRAYTALEEGDSLG